MDMINWEPYSCKQRDHQDHWPTVQQVEEVHPVPSTVTEVRYIERKIGNSALIEPIDLIAEQIGGRSQTVQETPPCPYEKFHIARNEALHTTRCAPPYHIMDCAPNRTAHITGLHGSFIIHAAKEFVTL